jgi:DNA processing protein
VALVEVSQMRDSTGPLSWLLDRRSPRRYLQRLAMLSSGAVNPSRETSKRADVPPDVSVASATDSQYPTRLHQLVRVPERLWFRGRLPGAGERGVAIVGSRAASAAGCARAAEIAAALTRQGLFVVSGGALGIDAAAHRGALDAGGVTFAVLGCGVDVAYPDRHRRLFERIAVKGGVMSELPPGSPPRPGCFPVRNRIVAALAELVLVVEARPLSGALITARLGWEQGRLLAAVPGSAGADQLINAGLAAPIETADDVARLLDGEVIEGAAVPAPIAAALEAVRAGAHDALAIARHMKVPISEALAVLADAELGGWLRRLAGGRFEVPRVN